MSCTRMENKILGYVDGRLKKRANGWRWKSLSLRVRSVPVARVNEFRAVAG